MDTEIKDELKDGAVGLFIKLARYGCFERELVHEHAVTPKEYLYLCNAPNWNEFSCELVFGVYRIKPRLERVSFE